MRHSLIFISLLTLAAAAFAQGLPGLGLRTGHGNAEASAVKAEITADTATLSDKPFTVAVTLTTPAGWHIYWSNPGDAGLPTTFKWQLPAGYTVQPAPLPVPTAFAEPGNETLYGYTGTTTFLFNIIPTPRKNASISNPVDFSVTADWLCCSKDECTPGHTTLGLKLYPSGVTGHAVAAADPSAFLAAREALPSDKPPSDITVSQATNLDASHHATVSLDLTFKNAPQSVEAFPDADDGLAITSVKADRHDARAHISLSAHRMGGQNLQLVSLPLLVVYTTPDPAKKNQSIRHGFFVTVDLTKLGDLPK